MPRRYVHACLDVRWQRRASPSSRFPPACILVAGVRTVSHPRTPQHTHRRHPNNRCDGSTIFSCALPKTDAQINSLTRTYMVGGAPVGGGKFGRASVTSTLPTWTQLPWPGCLTQCATCSGGKKPRWGGSAGRRHLYTLRWPLCDMALVMSCSRDKNVLMSVYALFVCVCGLCASLRCHCRLANHLLNQAAVASPHYPHSNLNTFSCQPTASKLNKWKLNSSVQNPTGDACCPGKKLKWSAFRAGKN